MNILLVVADPDDEILGAGGTIVKLTDSGLKAFCCIICGQADARSDRPQEEEFKENIFQANALIGLEKPVLGTFPNIKMNTVPHLDLVQFIEHAIVETEASTIFTHHPRDINDDHRQVSHACQVASRLFQRQTNAPALNALYFTEIASSSEWSMPGTGSPFDPDSFFEIGETGLKRKIEALKVYNGVMREYPHPRSPEAISGLAAYRGSQAGLRYAEAFQTAYKALNKNDFII